MKKIDRRVQKTNDALQEAFRKLARTYSYREITVKALTEEAHINRKTFLLTLRLDNWFHRYSRWWDL
jgi:hypothetical protein